MAAVRETLSLEDRFSAAFTRYINLGEQAAGATGLAKDASQNYQTVLNGLDRRLIALNGQYAASLQRQEAMQAAGMENTEAFARLDEQMERLGASIRDVSAQYDMMSAQAREAALAAQGVSRSQTEVVNALRHTDRQASQLTSTLIRLAASYLSVQGLQALAGTADALTQTTARLDRMNDGLQTTGELQEMIYQSAMRSRGAYAGTADLVSKLGTLAGDAFSSNRELVAFAEQLNKQMVLSGTSAAGAQGAMLQMTQALSSGVLRGEELNSILEQTPMIAQTIAGYLGVSTGEMRELASQGAVTADVVKNALLSAAEETDAAFAQVPLTWEQLWTMAQNVVMQGFQPFLGFVSSLPQLIVDNYEIVLALFLGIGAALAVVGAQALAVGAAFLLANWPILLLIAGVSAFAYGMMQAGATAEDVLGTVAMGFGFLYAFVGNVIIDLYNLWAGFAEFFANVFDHPLQAAANLFFDFIDTILGLLQTAVGAIDAVFGTNLSGLVGSWRASLSRWVSETIGDNVHQVERLDHIDYGQAMAGFEEIGRSFGGSLTNFANSFGSGGGMGDYGLDPAAYALDGLSNQLGSISGDTSALRREVALEKEDIRSLVDMAERRYVNLINLTAQTPVITVNGQNTGDSQADRQALANAIRDILVEQAAAASLLTTARAF